MNKNKITLKLLLQRMLHTYQKKCENEGSYAEAKKALEKMEEIKQKEVARQQSNIKYLQEEELLRIENAQKAQFLDFTAAWDNYMTDYEATAYISLEKLKVQRQYIYYLIFIRRSI